jgi:hypothetical protein
MTLLEIILEYRDEAQQFLLFIVVASALRWGAGPERATALVLAAMLLGDIAYHMIFGPGVNLLTIDLGHATIDLAALVALTTIAVAANRNYTLWIGALQIVAVLAHVARNLDGTISPLVYAIMYIAPSYFQIGLLGAGLIRHRRRSQTHGTYRSWRTSSPPSWATGRLSWLDA